MKDVGLVANKQLNSSDKAVDYFLRRMRHDPEFNWFVFGTGLFETMCEAGAAIAGLPVKEFKEKHSALCRSNDPVNKACARCEKVDPEDVTPYYISDVNDKFLLHQALQLIADLSWGLDDPVLSSRIEDLLEEVAKRHVGFLWRKHEAYEISVESLAK